MKIYGVVCELNPMHRGHAHLLHEAQKRADLVVCLMSGSFVQRGEPAIYDCFTRARTALENGADAVLALPTVFSLQAAEFFARGSVLCAQKAGCTHLLFGSESGDLSVMERETERTPRDQKNISYGHGYGIFENEPNHILGREYLTAIRRENAALTPETIRRERAFSSASDIRALIRDGKTSEDLLTAQSDPLFPEAIYPLLRHAVLSKTPEEAESVCGVAEGLQYKIIKTALTAKSRDEWIHAVKSKRYSYARIARTLCCMLLNIQKDDLQACLQSPPVLRVLGVKKEKAEMLSHLNVYAALRGTDKAEDATVLSQTIDRRAFYARAVAANAPADAFDRTGLIKV